MATLTRAEAAARAALIRVVDTSVELDLVEPIDTFTSVSVLTVEVAEPGGDTFLDLQAVAVESVRLDGAAVDTASWRDGRLPLTLGPGRHELRVVATMAYSNAGEGLHRHVTADGQRYLYAMSFLDKAPAWFACFDQPDLKSPYTLVARTPADWLVRGNGPAESLSDGETVRTWLLHQPVPISTYVVTLVAGPYVEVTAEHDGIALGLLARAELADELAEQSEDILAVTTACFDGYHALFGHRYPFGEYHQAFVPDFNAGAMENPGCVTFREQYLHRGRATRAELGKRASTIAHEMAHQWFGDLVTMRWWDDLWLNESFAEYMAQVMCERVTPYDRWIDFGATRKQWGMVADQSSSSHPVAGNGTDDAAAALQQFDGISYAKGAAVLRQLVLHIGEDVFLTGLRDYFTRYGRGNADFADLLQCWADAGADDIEQWSQAWLRTQGVDQLRAEGDGDTVTVHRIPAADPAHRAHIATVARIADDGAVVAEQAYRLEGDRVDVDLRGHDAAPGQDDLQQAGLLVPDAHDQTWARIDLPWPEDPSLAPSGVLADPSRIADPRTRVVIGSALRDAVRHARVPSSTAAEVLLGWLSRETVVDLFAPLGGFLVGELCGPYCPPAVRSARRGVAHDGFGDTIARAEPGGDLQLTAFRLAVATLDDVVTGERWLAGELPDPLELDRELEWALVTRLTSLDGDLGRVEAALGRDDSSSARIHAARARAAVPTRQAKQRAFEILTTDGPASAYEVYATAEGFYLPHQHELTADFVEPWFDRIGATGQFRDGWALGRVVSLSFPATHVDDLTISRAEALEADPDTSGPIRRAVADCLDELRTARRSLQLG
ncbi:MAG TPA: aminopeptidase N [Candidatus Avipropionibacterium avicola]|uniref:Aminopeptidase N n=1 Tax=Candidatus Avipropionibacterium avicola TaxID=2840701 RepID=A0A9D1GX58_9ACTN|nr:aminopeptidase N [Candidatus Avipropionibacterium avicola]